MEANSGGKICDKRSQEKRKYILKRQSKVKKEYTNSKARCLTFELSASYQTNLLLFMIVDSTAFLSAYINMYNCV